MTTVGKAFIEIRGDDTKLTGDLDGAKRQFDDFAGSIKAAFAASIAGWGAKEIWNWTTQLAAGAAKATDDLADFAQMSGIALDKVYQLQYAFGAAGENWEESSQALGLLARNIGQAAEGAEQQTAAFAKLGISVRTASGQIKTTDQVLLEMATAFERLADGPQKVALAMEVAGRGGKALIPILSEGGEKLQELIDKATSKGYVLSPEAAAEASRYLGSVNELDMAMGSLWREVGEKLQPVLKDLNTTFATWISENKDWISQDIAGVLNTVTSAVTMLGKAFEIIGPTIQFFTSSIGTAVEGLNRLWRELENIGSWIPGLEPSYDVTASKDWWIPKSGKDMWAQLKRDQKGRGAESEWQSIFGTPDRSIDVSKIVDVTNQLSGAAKSTAEAFSEFNRQLEIQIKLANLDYDALQRLGEMVRQGVVGPGGAGVSPTMLEEIPGQRTMPNLMENFPEAIGNWSMTELDVEALKAYTDAYFNLMNVMTMTPLGSAFQSMIDGFSNLNLQPMEDAFNSVLQTEMAFGISWQQAADFYGKSIFNFFSDAATNGFKNAGKKFLGALIQMFGQILGKLGMSMISTGLSEILIASNPFTRVLFPTASVAHGGMMIALGTALTAGGGLISGIGGGIASSAGASSGAASSYQSAGSAGTQSIEPITYTMGGPQGGGGGQPVNITINAMDSQSFNDYLEKNGETGVTNLMVRSFRSNGVVREMARW